MKKIIITFLLISSFAFCQEKTFKYKKDGTFDFVVTNVENKTTNEIYKKVINWVKDRYNTPDSVLKSEIENESIRFNGITSNVAEVFGGKYDVEYTIKISIKDNKYKFEVITFQLLNCSIKKDPWNPFNDSFYKGDGTIRKAWKEYPPSLERLFNGMNESIKTYILETSKDDKW